MTDKEKTLLGLAIATTIGADRSFVLLLPPNEKGGLVEIIANLDAHDIACLLMESSKEFSKHAYIETAVKRPNIENN